MEKNCKRHTDISPSQGLIIFSHQCYNERMLNEMKLFKDLLYTEPKKAVCLGKRANKLLETTTEIIIF